MKQPLYKIEHLAFGYEQKSVLTDISLSVQKGEKIAILGANGSGKSTLLKLLDGLQFAGHGSVVYNGERLTEKYFEREENEYAFRKDVGFVFQDPDVQLFNQTVLDEIRFGPLHMGIPKDEIDRRVTWAMETVDVMKLANRSPFTLSGGEKKRVSLASVLSIKPTVWLMDEPLASLDPRSQSTVIDFLSAAHDRGETTIITTHDILLLEELAERVLVLSEDHRLVADGTARELLGKKEFLIKHNLMHSHVHAHGKRMHAHKHFHETIHIHR